MEPEFQSIVRENADLRLPKSKDQNYSLPRDKSIGIILFGVIGLTFLLIILADLIVHFIP